MAGPYNSEPSPLYPGLCSKEHIQERQPSGLGEAWGGEHRLLNPWCPGAVCVLVSTLPTVPSERSFADSEQLSLRPASSCPDPQVAAFTELGTTPMATSPRTYRTVIQPWWPGT